MKIISCEQGTEAWFSARCGLPSASNFDKIIDTAGNSSKQRKKYLFQLAGERVTGKTEEGYQNGAMLRGKEMEAEAREFYEITTGETVEQVGFCVTDGPAIFGASPDGLIGEDGLLEIKCPGMATHVAYLLDGKLPSEYAQQVHGQLLVTGRKWCDFVSYFPGLKPLVVRVEPDPFYHEILRLAIEGFCEELDQVAKRIG